MTDNESPKEPSQEEVQVPEKFQSLISMIEQMSVLDLAELVKILEKKFGVSAQAPIAVLPAAGQGEDAQEAEVKESFDVELTSSGANKIAVIKVVREVTQKGLKESKDVVDKAPSMIKEGVKKAEAEEIKKKVEEAGGQASLK